MLRRKRKKSPRSQDVFIHLKKKKKKQLDHTRLINSLLCFLFCKETDDVTFSWTKHIEQRTKKWFLQKITRNFVIQD